MTGTDRADFLQPVLRRVLFWDVPLDHIDLDTHADWLIARVLWRGTLDDVRRVAAVFGSERVRAVAGMHRGLPDGFRPFWLDVFTEEVAPVHPETLAPNTREVLDQHGHLLCPDRFLLCGGTAVALYLGHRRSVDLDFFTAEPFDAAALADTLTRTVPGYTADVVSPGTVHGRVQDVEVSHIHQIGVSLPTDGVYAGVPLASLPALCAMKCNALSTRGERKDFLDVYALALAAGGITPVLRHAFTHAPGLNRVHVLRSLTFFTDADASPMPEMLVPWDWATVRDAFTRFAHAETRRALDLPGPHL